MSNLGMSRSFQDGDLGMEKEPIKSMLLFSEEEFGF